MLLAIFANIYELVQPIPVVIFSGGGRKQYFCVFFCPYNLNFSWPMRFQDLYIGANRLFCFSSYIQGLKGLFQVQNYCLTSTQRFFYVIIELLVTKTWSYTSIHRQTVFHNLLYCNKRFEKVFLCWNSFFVPRINSAAGPQKRHFELSTRAITHRLSTRTHSICFHW